MSEPDAPPSPVAEPEAPAIRTAVEIAIRLGVIALLVGWCLMIVAPFVGIVIWAMIIAVGAGTPFEKLCGMLGHRRGLAATLVVLIVLAVLFVPAVMLSETLVVGAQHFAEDVGEGKVHVPPPPNYVADWPVVGERIHDTWQLASENLGEALLKLRPQLETVSRWLLKTAAGAGAGLLQLIASVLIAGVMLARSEGRRVAIERFARRLAGGDRGPALAEIAQSTVQSVVQGIVGVALLQALMAGLGFIVAGIAGAGLWALLVLVAAVVQLPVALVMVPPVLIAWSTLGPAAATVLTIWCVVIGLIDNVLKPILFGRGTKVPTVVVFLGAIGGMISMGIIGLFLGAVVLALGYELFNAWLVPDTEVPDPA